MTQPDASAQSIPLVRMEGGYKGYNTDADGLYRAIMGHGIDPEGKDCLMIEPEAQPKRWRIC